MLPRLSGTRLIALGFAGFILLGTLLLKLPEANTGITWIDALFEATSAVTVTGLQVVDPATDFTTFGQGIIASLIQVGGLGIMTVTTTVALLLGRKLGFRQARTVQQEMESPGSPRSILTLLGRVALFTAALEAIGAAILATRFYFGNYDLAGAIGYGVFHSISAFCNAGFDIFKPSLGTLYAGDLVVNAVFIVLIVLGGLGFPVLVNLYSYPRTRRFTLHSKIVLITSAVLIVFGAGSVAVLEWTNPATLGGDPLGKKLLESLFQGVTPRTAGFSTLDYPDMRHSTLLLQIVLMFIGAAPASTGGGIKVTTLALIFLIFVAQARGTEEISVFHRQIPTSLVAKTLSVFALSAFLVILATVVLIATENKGLLQAVFHVTSALGTVGLNLFSSAKLTFSGKLLTIFLMFAGRLGPITLILALSEQARTRNYSYPEEEIAIG